MNRYIIKLVNAISGQVMFIASGNRTNAETGKQTKCANCFKPFLVVRRTDRFCSPSCQTKFTKEVRDFESKYGKLTINELEAINITHKPIAKSCLNKECRKRFYTKAPNHFFCSVECRKRYNLLIKYKSNKHWMRRDRIRKNEK